MRAGRPSTVVFPCVTAGVDLFSCVTAAGEGWAFEQPRIQCISASGLRSVDGVPPVTFVEAHWKASHHDVHEAMGVDTQAERKRKLALHEEDDGARGKYIEERKAQLEQLRSQQVVLMEKNEFQALADLTRKIAEEERQVAELTRGRLEAQVEALDDGAELSAEQKASGIVQGDVTVGRTHVLPHGTVWPRWRATMELPLECGCAHRKEDELDARRREEEEEEAARREEEATRRPQSVGGTKLPRLPKGTQITVQQGGEFITKTLFASTPREDTQAEVADVLERIVRDVEGSELLVLWVPPAVSALENLHVEEQEEGVMAERGELILRLKAQGKAHDDPPVTLGEVRLPTSRGRAFETTSTAMFPYETAGVDMFPYVTATGAAADQPRPRF